MANIHGLLISMTQQLGDTVKRQNLIGPRVNIPNTDWFVADRNLWHKYSEQDWRWNLFFFQIKRMILDLTANKPVQKADNLQMNNSV